MYTCWETRHRDQKKVACGTRKTTRKMKAVVFLVLQTTFRGIHFLYSMYIIYKISLKTICFIVFPALAERKTEMYQNHYANMMFYIHLLRKCKRSNAETIPFPICFEQLYIIYMIYENHWYSCVSHTPRKPIKKPWHQRIILWGNAKMTLKPCANLYNLNGCAPTPKTL